MVLKWGQEKFGVYCTPCHSAVGDGRGAVVLRGFSKMPPSYHEDRLRKAPLGHFYDVATNGYGAMLNYAAQTTPQDRWAIAAYIRALQLSQNATMADVPPGQHNNIKQPVTVSGAEHTKGPSQVGEGQTGTGSTHQETQGKEKSRK